MINSFWISPLYFRLLLRAIWSYFSCDSNKTLARSNRLTKSMFVVQVDTIPQLTITTSNTNQKCDPHRFNRHKFAPVTTNSSWKNHSNINFTKKNTTSHINKQKKSKQFTQSWRSNYRNLWKNKSTNQGFPYATTGDENWNSSIEVVAGEERRRKNQSEGCREMIW